LEGSKVVIIEGILALYHPDVRSIFDLKIFVEADSDLRLARRLRRDIAERGRTVDNVLTQYERTVKPSFEQFTHPTKQYADIIIPFNHHNAVAIDLVVDVVTRAMGHQHKHHQH
jgi:uridine kinase